MSTERHPQKIGIVWTNNQSQPIFVADFRNVELTVVGTGAVSLLASKDMKINPIDFTIPSTINNSYAQVVLFDETVVASPFVLALTVAGSTKVAEVDSNLDTWICLTRTADTVDAFITYCDNQ